VDIQFSSILNDANAYCLCDRVECRWKKRPRSTTTRGHWTFAGQAKSCPDRPAELPAFHDPANNGFSLLSRHFARIYLKSTSGELNCLHVARGLRVGGQLDNKRLLSRGLLLHQMLLTITADLNELQLLPLLVEVLLQRVLGGDDKLLLVLTMRLIIRVPKTRRPIVVTIALNGQKDGTSTYILLVDEAGDRGLVGVNDGESTAETRANRRSMHAGHAGVLNATLASSALMFRTYTL
jgi:hypothetical protein